MRHLRTVNILQAGALCGVSRRTIYNWLGTNKIQYVRTAGGAVRIFADSLFKAGNVIPSVKHVSEIQSDGEA